MGSKKGFTLIELLIAISIAGLISVLTAGIYFAHFRLFSNQNTSMDVSAQNKLGLDEMTNEIRASQSIAASCCSGAESSGATNLVLQFWPLDASGDPFSPPSVNDYDFIIYKRDPLDSTKLQKIISPDDGSTRTPSTKIISTEISDLQFAYEDTNRNPVSPELASVVIITLSTSANSGSKNFTTTQTSKAALRNK